ncbi:hypothetical protein NDU88_003717 [Pleurodeles waltl]|uniref:Uncharacterized protein n=1 Tax=Pleurodeles waltl TaxID=8319 RepID=A0AAV7M472_PLEWA|nr:hypothetical protein NDU88_003717 [Pleurodeles waltl]
MWALPSAQLCHERMMQHFGATLLEHLECDWSLSFRPVLDCVQPVFRCHWCSFEHALDVCLSQQRPPVVDADLLMFPMRAHYQTCALQLRLLREADYELPFLKEVDDDSFKGPLTLAWTMNSPPPPPALVDRRHRHRNTTPAPHSLQLENHPASSP